MGNGTCNPGSEASLNVKRELIWVLFFKKVVVTASICLLLCEGGMTAAVGSVLSRRWGKEDV
jgi:hypothetical protein